MCSQPSTPGPEMCEVSEVFQLNFSVPKSRRITLSGERQNLEGKTKNMAPKQFGFALSSRTKRQKGRGVSEVQLWWGVKP